MKQVQRVLVNYSADLFGMCSALYELGGLCVMDDASGCNSTYDTHDEPRWFDMDSMIYISALTENDAVMGNDNKLIDDICEVAEAERPKFIALGGSPIPMMMGTDFKGLARVIEKRTGIPSFGIKSSGMHTYEIGAGQAFAALVDAFCVKAVQPGEAADRRAALKQERKSAGSTYRIGVNILGVTPLDFSIVGNAESLTTFFEQNGCTVISSWAMGCTLEQLSLAGLADVNIVVSSTGLSAARRLQEVYGTPYVTGIPIGARASFDLLDRVYTESGAAKPEQWNADVPDVAGGPFSAAAKGNPLLADARLSTDEWNLLHAHNAEDKACSGGIVHHASFPLRKSVFTARKDAVVCIIGEPVFASSLRSCLETDCGANHVQIICPLEETCGLLRECDVQTEEEDGIGECMCSADILIADPVYRRIVPKNRNIVFIDFPHEAYSGRLYRAEIPVFIGKNILV
jgi:nitrogenase molybdenum-cofactor synthesis protein NifE